MIVHFKNNNTLILNEGRANVDAIRDSVFVIRNTLEGDIKYYYIPVASVHYISN